MNHRTDPGAPGCDPSRRSWSAVFSLLLPLFLMFAAAPVAAITWNSSVDPGGFPSLESGGERSVTVTPSFWKAQWAWAGMSTQVRAVPPGGYDVDGASKGLGLTMSQQTRRQGPDSWTVDFVFKSGGVSDASGGGLVFRFNLPAWGTTLGQPVLLPDKTGWRWGSDGATQMEVRFDKPLTALYFEKSGELRAMFFKDGLPAGEWKIHSTWQISKAAYRPPVAERYGDSLPADWPLDDLREPRLAPDLSFLNKNDRPAGTHGPLRTNGERLSFADGTPARFWGTNVAGNALFLTPKADVKDQAHRLAQLGYNLVRIHHHDSAWLANNVFGKTAALSDTKSLDEDAMDRIDWWIKCLKDEGIYVWLDLHVQRGLREGDGIDGFDEIRKGKPSADLKGFNYVNPSIQKAMLRFDQAYLEHRNSYTGVAYKDEPAVAAALITNENDVTTHFGNAMLPDKKVPEQNRLYMEAAGAFAKASGLPSNLVWRSWEPGPSKLFLNDLEHRFDVDMLAGIRGVGAKMPIATTSTWGSSPISSLPALTTGNLIDVHAYSRNGALEKNPLKFPNLVDWVATAHVRGFPLTVSEWNAEPFPTSDRHVLPLYMAASASHQGWNALMHFAFTQEPVARNTPSNWNSYNDPSLLAMMPAAALLFREHHVAEATSTYVFDPGADVFFNQAPSAANSPALRTAHELGKLLIAMPATKELPWLKTQPNPAGAIVFRDPAKSFLPEDASRAVSDTGELTRDWGDGVYTINTPLSRAAMGWIGGRTVTLPDVDFKLTTANAALAVQSLDGQPLGQSTDMMLSMAARSQPKPGNKAPFLGEPLAGELDVRAPAGLKVFVRDSDGTLSEWPSSYRQGVYKIELDGKRIVHWLFIRRAA